MKIPSYILQELTIYNNKDFIFHIVLILLLWVIKPVSLNNFIIKSVNLLLCLFSKFMLDPVYHKITFVDQFLNNFIYFISWNRKSRPSNLKFH